jgi:hypothetical protein
MQQWSLLRESGIKSPDPIKWFYQDLSTELQAWTNKGYEILLMMDANEHIGEKPGGIGKIISTFKLTDLILYKHPEKEIPNTYSRGKRRIDYIFGTSKVTKHCQEAGILPFGMGFPSDHRGVFIRLNIEQVLQSTVIILRTTFLHTSGYFQSPRFYLNEIFCCSYVAKVLTLRKNDQE